MQKRIILAAFLWAIILFVGCASGSKAPKEEKDIFQPILTDIPERPAGQKDVLGLVTPKLDTVRVGFIGLGMRGPGAVQRFTHIPGTKIVALCDLHADRVEKSQQILDNAGLPRAAEYSGSVDAWKQLCKRDDINLVYIATDWKHHAEMMIYAMEQGK
ncbi:MAG TPA: glycosyl hydrolase, partial [Porphyromonadaceae bacterium]|nr:glycosyl hydrolase [Porphyromonadaceae bacterium]